MSDVRGLDQMPVQWRDNLVPKNTEGGQLLITVNNSDTSFVDVAHAEPYNMYDAQARR